MFSISFLLSFIIYLTKPVLFYSFYSLEFIVSILSLLIFIVFCYEVCSVLNFLILDFIFYFYL